MLAQSSGLDSVSPLLSSALSAARLREQKGRFEAYVREHHAQWAQEKVQKEIARLQAVEASEAEAQRRAEMQKNQNQSSDGAYLTRSNNNRVI